MKTLIAKLRNGIDLTSGDINYAMSMLLSESTEDGTKAEFLMALHRKGESVEEIVAFVQQLIDRAIDPLIDPKNLSGPMLDVCGTGGDGLDLFNVSTTIMFVLAAGGVAVVKHGNRSVTSRCGSADVLEALGLQITLPPARLKECVERHGLQRPHRSALAQHPGGSARRASRRSRRGKGRLSRRYFVREDPGREARFDAGERGRWLRGVRAWPRHERRNRPSAGADR